MLLARETWQGLAQAWRDQTGPMAERLNAMPKYVVSATLESADEWDHTTIVGYDDIAGLREREQLLTYGCGRLARNLLADGLLDVLVLSLTPVVAGAGRRRSTTPATSSGCGSPTARPSRPAPCGCSSSRITPDRSYNRVLLSMQSGHQKPAVSPFALREAPRRSGGRSRSAPARRGQEDPTNEKHNLRGTGRSRCHSRTDERIRTADPFITSEVLYQLSYGGVSAKSLAPRCGSARQAPAPPAGACRVGRAARPRAGVLRNVWPVVACVAELQMPRPR